MATFFFTFIFFSLVVTAMAVGVIMGRKPITGSCGGMGALGMVSDCEICGGDRMKCEAETPAGRQRKTSFYGAAE